MTQYSIYIDETDIPNDKLDHTSLHKISTASLCTTSRSDTPFTESRASPTYNSPDLSTTPPGWTSDIKIGTPWSLPPWVQMRIASNVLKLTHQLSDQLTVIDMPSPSCKSFFSTIFLISPTPWLLEEYMSWKFELILQHIIKHQDDNAISVMTTKCINNIVCRD